MFHVPNFSVPPLIERFAFDENLYEGMRTRVYCNIARGDQPLTIRWLKNNLPLQSGAQLQVRQPMRYVMHNLLSDHLIRKLVPTATV